MEKTAQMVDLAARVEAMIHDFSHHSNRAAIKIDYDRPTADDIHRYNEWDRKYFHIAPGEEYFVIYEIVPYEPINILYVVNVTCDSVLTAANELMDTVARKF